MKTLADLQRAPGTKAEAIAALPLSVQRTRTFDTPEFAGMTFLEVEAKTALNRVKGMGFGWSINPYRGCSHACSYCLSGETPILMADGRTKRLSDVEVGDWVYGTVRKGSYRQYAVTPVLDHWSTVRSAYRIRLGDGTQLVASGDHRFLTRRGWKHVTGAEQGRGRRPHLTLHDELLGTGGFSSPPKDTAEYRRGYLCGMIRGDAHLGSYAYERPARARGAFYRFRLALVDDEGLERTQRYLQNNGVQTQRFLFQRAAEGRREINAIRTSSRANYVAIRRLIAWPLHPSTDWVYGFLAGIFDAEGSYGEGALRIHNTDDEIIGQIRACLRELKLDYTLEAQPNGCQAVRLLGGLREHLRFLHTVDPAITRKRTIADRALKSRTPLRVVAVEPLGLDLPLFDITTGTGDFIADGVVSHNCFARPTHRYLNMSPLGDFERMVVVKTNLVEVLRREVARPTWKGEHVAMGTNTDPYQRCEGRYRLMPGVIDTLAASRTPFSILTKGTMITRDVERLRAAAELVPVTAAFTVGMLDRDLWRRSEPGTPSPQARLAAVNALNEAGIPTGVMLAPIMPGLNDDREQLAALVDAAAQAQATHITPIVLHLRPGVREVFWPWLEVNHPELVQRYIELYRRAQAPKAFRDDLSRFVGERRKAAWKRYGKPEESPSPRGTAQPRRGVGAPEVDQLTLW